MRHSIRPDVHARFLALVARADAKLRSEQPALKKRSIGLLAREARERGPVARGRDDERNLGGSILE